ncbi:AcrR family transcriptional regulator [Nocardia sp. GAS34]|uniref:TetR/AcrR family transcriptional regulator n=1 Tax=unclassified Nocardia TaxID=2637762 RepID=UPI003D1F8E32
MTRIGRPSNADSRRQEVLSVAADVFSRGGYRGTTMVEIANASGISKPTLYHYFKNKEEILVRLYEDVMEQSVEQAEHIAVEVENPADALHALIKQRVVATCENQAIHKVFFEEEEELPRPMMEKLLQSRHEYEDIFKSVLLRLRDDGYPMTDPVDATLYVNTCLGAANWVYKWYDPNGSRTPEDIGSHIANYLLAGLAAMSADISLTV